jgi:hypothetical protein
MLAARLSAIVILAQLVACDSAPIFSADDFKRATGHDLPASARLVKSESMNWDAHGDHDACALIEVSEKDYAILSAAIHPGAPSAAKPSNAPCSESMYAAFAQYQVRVAEYASWDGGGFRHWALVEGKPLIMVQVATW